MMAIAGWDKYVNCTAVKLAASLGVAEAERVQAQLYKLLLYQPGDHFTAHRDTEKAPGMFATMVILLPSAYEASDIMWHLAVCLCCQPKR